MRFVFVKSLGIWFRDNWWVTIPGETMHIISYYGDSVKIDYKGEEVRISYKDFLSTCSLG